MRHPRRRIALVALFLIVVAALSGCYRLPEYAEPRAVEIEKACGTEECHAAEVAAQSGGPMAFRDCVKCHEGATGEHAKDPKKARAGTDWRIDACAECHTAIAATYLYDDNTRVGPFGGSQRRPPEPKAATFPEYKTIVAGHAFTRDYNEEGAHRFMLEDHYATLRGKFETCVQCKSSKLAYAWKEGKPLVVAEDTEITLTHTAAPGVQAKKVKVPKGTTLTYATDSESRLVDAQAKLPDGTVYSSKPKPSDDATLSNNMIWASTIAAIKETMPYGAGCNHCHDPHSGAKRVLRQAMIESIEGEGGVKGTGGVNPYQEDSAKSFEEATAKDKNVLMCAQCHVEYVCGKSGIDKKDRDAFGWAKATDLHDLYTNQFGYAQDFKNAIMGEPLIKSQHSETELYWNSPHYDAGASCVDCHMPVVRQNNREFRSHWFTSPYKYGDAERYAAFAAANRLDAGMKANPCTQCHADRTARGIEQQKAFFAAQARVEKLLAQSVNTIGALKRAGRAKDPQYAEALEAHQRAHAVWENLAVSENSMGFHNFDEAMTAMAEAEKNVRTALSKETQATK